MPNINLRTVGATPQGPVENVVGSDGYAVPGDVGKVLMVQPDGTIAPSAGAGGFPAPATSQQLFVGTFGNDLTGDGTMGKPYATVTHAQSTILDASAVKRYEINVLPGQYTENIDLMAFVAIVGWDPSTVEDDYYPARITGSFQLGASFATAFALSWLTNLDIDGDLTLNFGGMAVDARVTVSNCQTENPVSLDMDTSNVCEFHNCVFLDDCTHSGGQCLFFNTIGVAPTATLTIRPRLFLAASIGATFSADGGSWAGNVVFKTLPAAGAVTGITVDVLLRNFTANRGSCRLTEDATNTLTVAADEGALPQNSTIDAPAGLGEEMEISQQFRIPNGTVVPAASVLALPIPVPAALTGATNIEDMHNSCCLVGAIWGGFVDNRNGVVTFVFAQIAGVNNIVVVFNNQDPVNQYTFADLHAFNWKASRPRLLAPPP